MQTFKDYNTTKFIECELLAITMLENSDDLLVEGKLDSVLKKAGLSIHKKKGLIQYLTQAGVVMTKFFVAVLKGDKQTLKKLANTEIKKEEVVNFLLQLDQATLHLITGPIHMKDAITGWHIGADLHTDISSSVKELIKKAVSTIKDHIHKLIPNKNINTINILDIEKNLNS